MKNGSMPVNPIVVDELTNPGYSENTRLAIYAEGLTKREYFAAMAMQGIIAADGSLSAASLSSDQNIGGMWLPSEIAIKSVSYADALLSELDKTESK